MKLRTKTLITVTLLSIVIFVSLQSITYFILQPSFTTLEQQESIEKINQAQNIIDYRISDLTAKVKDYAFWDDTYNFVQNQNEKFIQDNFVDSTFENLNLNLVAIVNNQTNIIYVQSYDLNQSAKTQTPTETQKTLTSDNYIWKFNSSNTAISGLMVIDNKPMVVSTSPVLTSQEQGPAEGALLFGRYLDAQEINDLSKLIGIDFSLTTIANSTVQQQKNTAATSPVTDTQTVVLKEDGLGKISGFTTVDDIHSNPMFILKVNHISSAYLQSVWVGNVFLLAAIVFSFLFGLAMLILLEREIVKPMRKLADYVNEISLNPNSSAPTVVAHAAEEVAIVTNAVRDTLKRKFEGMNEVSRMVAHDLRNPLAGIRNATFVLKKRHSLEIGESGMSMLQIIDECVMYSDKIVQNLLDYSSEMSLEKIKITPKKLVDDALSKFILPSNIKLVNQASDDLTVVVDCNRIERVFTNLIVNALDAMPNGGTLEVTSRKVKNSVQIDFSDTGVGMSGAVLEKVMVAFFHYESEGDGYWFVHL